MILVEADDENRFALGALAELARQRDTAVAVPRQRVRPIAFTTQRG